MLDELFQIVKIKEARRERPPQLVVAIPMPNPATTKESGLKERGVATASHAHDHLVAFFCPIRHGHPLPLQISCLVYSTTIYEEVLWALF